MLWKGEVYHFLLIEENDVEEGPVYRFFGVGGCEKNLGTCYWKTLWCFSGV